jgi:hypothetical protein
MEYCGAGSVCDLMAMCERTLSEDQVGHNLRAAPRARAEPAVRQIAVVCKQAAMGLRYLHGQVGEALSSRARADAKLTGHCSQRKLHRDIKSGNLLLTAAGECKLGACVPAATFPPQTHVRVVARSGLWCLCAADHQLQQARHCHWHALLVRTAGSTRCAASGWRRGVAAQDGAGGAAIDRVRRQG